MSLEFGVPKRDNVPGSDLVELLDGRVREVGVNEGAVGSITDRRESAGDVLLEEIRDEGLWRAIPHCSLFLGGDGLGDERAELCARFLELILTEAGGWGFVVLFKGSFAGFTGVVVHGNVGLGIVGVEDVDYAGGVLAAASSGSVGVFDFVNDVLSGLKRWWRCTWLGPPLRLSIKVYVARDRSVLT